MATRTREEILAGVQVIDGHVWATCGHCGGTGSYPSSMLPPGQCRFYCWHNRTPETFGKLPVEVDKYVRRQQAADRRQARAIKKFESERVERERLAGERAARVASPDERIARLSEVTGIAILSEGPAEWDVPNRDRFSCDIIRTYVNRGNLSEGQWNGVARVIAEREEESARKARASHVGDLGERITLAATFTGLRSFPSQYGDRYLLRFQDADGSTLVWWTSAGTEFPEMEEGQNVNIVATVKEHGHYAGEPQTTLSRCRITPAKVKT